MGSARSVKNRQEKRLHLQFASIEQQRLKAKAEIEQSTAENKQSEKDVEAACGRLCAGARGISAAADQARRELVVQRAKMQLSQDRERERRKQRERQERQEQQQRRERL